MRVLITILAVLAVIPGIVGPAIGAYNGAFSENATPLNTWGLIFGSLFLTVKLAGWVDRLEAHYDDDLDLDDPLKARLEEG